MIGRVDRDRQRGPDADLLDEQHAARSANAPIATQNSMPSVTRRRCVRRRTAAAPSDRPLSRAS